MRCQSAASCRNRSLGWDTIRRYGAGSCPNAAVGDSADEGGVGAGGLVVEQPALAGGPAAGAGGGGGRAGGGVGRGGGGERVGARRGAGRARGARCPQPG